MDPEGTAARVTGRGVSATLGFGRIGFVLFFSATNPLLSLLALTPTLFPFVLPLLLCLIPLAPKPQQPKYPLLKPLETFRLRNLLEPTWIFVSMSDLPV